MRKRKRLYIFSANYPYTHNGGELSFLRPEISVLVGSFEITVVPMNPFGILIDDAEAILEIDLRYAKLCRRLSGMLSFFRSLFFVSVWAEIRQCLKNRQVNAVIQMIQFMVRFGAAYRWKQEKSINSEDVLYTYWCTGTTLGLIEGGNSKTITRAHRYDLYANESEIGYIFGLRQVYDRADRFVVISEDGARYLKDCYGERTNVRVSRLGVENKDKTAAMSPDGVLRILSVSSITEIKRVSLIHDVCLDLLNWNDNIHISWTHIGSGPEERVISEKLLKQSHQCLDVAFAGQLSNADVCSYYESHPVDVFLHASASEGIPVAIQEALSYGVPIIAVDVGGVRESVPPGTGYLAPSISPREGLLAALKAFYLLDDAEKLKMRQNAINVQQNYYNCKANFAVMSKILLGEM